MLWKLQRYFYMERLKSKTETLIEYLENMRYDQSSGNLNKARFMFAEVVYLWEECRPWGKYFITGEGKFSWEVPKKFKAGDDRGNPNYQEWKDIIEPLLIVIKKQGFEKSMVIDIKSLSV